MNLQFENACDNAAYAAFACFEKLDVTLDLPPEDDDGRSDILTDLNLAIAAVMQKYLRRAE